MVYESLGSVRGHVDMYICESFSYSRASFNARVSGRCPPVVKLPEVDRSPEVSCPLLPWNHRHRDIDRCRRVIDKCRH